MAIGKICVIGSGTMGSGIAQIPAQVGYEATLVDIKQEFLDQSKPGLNHFSQLFG
ncbi:MAG TPA: 3-hydroxyacyl-CoA dehydrogenase NAD-binding domain-containing protein [Dehalococcoidia bacterium]